MYSSETGIVVNSYFRIKSPTRTRGSQGIMMYPPQNPTKKDAFKLANSIFLPQIQVE